MRIIPIMPIESMYGMVYQRAGRRKDHETVVLARLRTRVG